MAPALTPRAWSGRALRHIPAGSRYDVLDFRFAGRSAGNRWNRPGDPTLYLASDRAVALEEFARHLEAGRSGELKSQTVERALFWLDSTVQALIDVGDASAQQALLLKNAPHCFLEREVAQTTARFLRRTTLAEALLVPSVAFLDEPDRWVLALFLEKLPVDIRRFINAVEPAGVFRVGTRI